MNSTTRKPITSDKRTARLFSRRRQLLARKNRLAGKPSDALAETLTEFIAVSSACEPLEVSA